MNNRKLNPLTQALNEASEKSRREGHELIRKAKLLDDQRMKIKISYHQAFKDLDLEKHNLYVRTSYYKPVIELNLNALENFKDPQLVEILEFFSARTEKITTRDWALYLNRDYAFELEDVMVNISAFVKADSPTCRKVQTGIKVEEVPQYKLVCD